MNGTNLPSDERQRCDALQRYGVLNTSPESSFDDITRLAANLCETPISHITFLDDQGLWYKSQFGSDLAPSARVGSFCSYTILQSTVFVVRDATSDERFVNNPLVTSSLRIGFYAGVPISTPDGFRIGALSVIDRIPRELSAAQIDGLKVLVKQVVAQLEVRRHLNERTRMLEGHQRVEELLRTSEKFYQTLVETLPQNILRKDAQGRFTFANRRFCQSVGKPLEEILGKTDFDLFPSDLASKYHRDDLRVMSTQENLDTIEAHQGSQGAKMFVHVIKTPLYGPSGTVIGIQGIFWDVTQRRRIEEQLADERDLLRALLDHIPDRIYFKDVYSRFMRCSRSMANRLGLADPCEVVGKTDFDFHPAEMAREFFYDEQRILLTGEPLVNKLEKQVGVDGKEIWASVTKVPIFSQSGMVTGIVGLSRDITQLKETEQALRQAEEKYRAIYENSVEGIFQTTRDGHFLSANPALARMYGYSSPSELVAALTDIAHQLYVNPDRREEFRRLVREHGSVTGFESEIYRRDGAKIWISESARPVTDPLGNLLYYEGIVEDITARKLADIERERAREAALESARTKAQFLANMSHEIRTPMNAITGMTGMLIDTKLSQEQREYVETIHHSTESLLDIINDILDFSKIEAGKLALEVIEFELREIIETAIEMLAERAHKKRIELACWIDDSVPRRVLGDPVRLRQVLANLTSNAVKFTDSGEVVLRVSQCQHSIDQATLRFEVRDTGIGIAPEVTERIFQEFTQADGSTTRRYGGTGLGLTISKQLVEMMGGEIGVESKPGEGSTFWLEIPFEVGREFEPLNVSGVSVEGVRIFVVDDTPVYRRILFQQLRACGAMVEDSADSADALRRLTMAADSGSPFSIVFIDCDTDDGDGLSLAQNIRNDTKLSTTRIIILCTLLNRLNPTTMRATGISACLIKPVRQNRLQGCLKEVLAVSSRIGDSENADNQLVTTPTLGADVTRSTRILLAEDNIVNQQVALKQLKKLGFSADAVSNGIEVLSALQRVPYDIIIMDCQMPEMDGYEVTARIRQGCNDSYIHLRSAPYIIALTANAMHGDRERCLTLGMNDYLTKPLHLHQLEAALQTALTKSGRPTISESATFSESQTLDHAVIEGLKELREAGQPDPLRELIDLFFRDTAPRLEAMERAVESADRVKLATAAHSLKGSASNLGARRLALLCDKVEREARVSANPLSEVTFFEVKAELKKVERILRSEIEKS